MWDKFDIRIPFKFDKVRLSAASTLEKPIGWVDFRDYDFPKCIPLVDMVDGHMVVNTSDLKSVKWQTISSNIAGMAIGFFPEGQGFDTWPCVHIKASPAKILQGHNVFGSCDPLPAIIQMFLYLKMSFEKLSADLDFEEATMRYTDSTFSSRIKEFFSRKIFSSMESLASARTKISKNIDYLQLGKDSEYQRQKLYKKMQEVLADLADAKRNKHQHRIAVLGDQRLLDFCVDLHRFEATTGHRKFADLGIPVRIPEFVKFNQWFYDTHKIPLCQYLWEMAFNPLFAQFEGHTIMNVDDSNIKLQIDAKFIRVKDNGKVCKRKANAVWATYCDIKREGYDTLAAIHNNTFFRNVRHLEEIGLSRAFLKSLDPNKPHADVVVPFIKKLEIDFNNQRPDWYVEPVADLSVARQLRLVS